MVVVGVGVSWPSWGMRVAVILIGGVIACCCCEFFLVPSVFFSLLSFLWGWLGPCCGWWWKAGGDCWSCNQWWHPIGPGCQGPGNRGIHGGERRGLGRSDKLSRWSNRSVVSPRRCIDEFLAPTNLMEERQRGPGTAWCLP